QGQGLAEDRGSTHISYMNDSASFLQTRNFELDSREGIHQRGVVAPLLVFCLMPKSRDFRIWSLDPAISALRGPL
ncbi:MAG: hypothetical protein QNL04_09370, partial [SAR324 cluster bacterium]|nr:hypothetical protein [SAR324 cluster bacterium]